MGGGPTGSRRVGRRLASPSAHGECEFSPLSFHPMTLQERLDRHLSCLPDVARANWVAANATLVGDVTLGPQSSVFYGAVLRGDIARIVVGEGTNIQDNAVVHLADDLDAIIGNWCTIGHSAIVHACTIEDECLIGMGSIVMDGCVLEENSMLAAGAMLTPGKTIAAFQMWGGRPARMMRELDENWAVMNQMAVAHYVHNGQSHKAAVTG